MGCDIHCYAEIKKGGKWQVVEDRIFPNPYHDNGIEKRLRELKAIKNPTPDELDQIKFLEENDDLYTKFCSTPYRGRNYCLFSILADVRNYFHLNIIADPKGIPQDASKEVLKSSQRWADDGHSHSWLTAKELLNFDWSQMGTLKGVMPAKIYEEWIERYKKDGTPPYTYSQAVGGQKVEVLSAGDYSKYKRANQLDPDKHCYIRAEWRQSYESMSTHFLKNTLSVLKTLGDPEKVRLVFWFDN